MVNRQYWSFDTIKVVRTVVAARALHVSESGALNLFFQILPGSFCMIKLLFCVTVYQKPFCEMINQDNLLI